MTKKKATKKKATKKKATKKKAFEHVGDVAWRDLKDGIGKPATYVPRALSALLSPNPHDRDYAREVLFEHSSGCPQIYPLVTQMMPAVVPFVIEALGHPEIRDADRLLDDLARLYRARSYAAAHHRDDADADCDCHEAIEKEQVWVEATRQAIRDGAPVYARLLCAPDREADSRDGWFDEDTVLVTKKHLAHLKKMREYYHRTIERHGGRAEPSPNEGALTRVAALFLLAALSPVPAGFPVQVVDRLAEERNFTVRTALLLALAVIASHLVATERQRGLAPLVATLRDGNDAERTLAAFAVTGVDPSLLEEEHVRLLGRYLTLFSRERGELPGIDPQYLGEGGHDLTPRSVVEKLCALEESHGAAVQQILTAWFRRGIDAVGDDMFSKSTARGQLEPHRFLVKRLFGDWSPSGPTSPFQRDILTIFVESNRFWDRWGSPWSLELLDPFDTKPPGDCGRNFREQLRDMLRAATVVGS
ncbi:hypothetical protein ACFL59_12145 [Planctomycetota bacterium]